MTRKPKSLEQRLYEAALYERGIKLSAKEVFMLLFDDAMETRVCNKAATDAGYEMPGEGGRYRVSVNNALSWEEFGEVFKDDNN